MHSNKKDVFVLFCISRFNAHFDIKKSLLIKAYAKSSDECGTSRSVYLLISHCI